MPFDGRGNFSLPLAPFQSNTVIKSGDVNTTFTDIASALSSGRTIYPTGSGSVNAQIGTTYTLVPTDNGRILTFTNAALIVVTVPSGLGSGFSCNFINLGAGNLNLVGSGGVVINGFVNPLAQYKGGELVAVAADSFVFEVGSSSNSSTNWPNTINVADFGAKGDGFTDDTVALQAAYTSVFGTHALVLWPNGTYKTTDTINCGNATGGAGAAISFISTLAPGGLDGATINYGGPSDGRPAFRLAGNKYAIVKGLTINNTGSLGTSIGLQMGGRGAGDSGNSTLSIDLDQIRVTGFHTGITDGNFGACSEITFRNLTLGNCDTGFVANNFNTLNIVFILGGAGNCGIGFDTGVSTGLTFYGASTSSNTTATWVIRQNSINTSIYGARDELSYISVAADVNAGSVTIKDCLFGSGTGPFSIGGLSRTGKFNRLSIDGCQLSLPVQGQALFLTMENCIAQNTDPTTKLPFIPGNSDTFSGNTLHATCRNNYGDVGQAAVIDDFIGTINPTSYTEGTVFSVNLYRPHLLKRFQNIVNTPDTGSPYGGDYLALSNVRQLSEGPLPGALSLTPQITLVTNGATAAGNNVLHFASVPNTIQPLMLVTDDTTPGGLPGNEYVSRTVAKTSTTVTLNGNASGGGVLNGDTIRFWPNLGQVTEGKNLRITGTFAASNSLAYTFIRSISAQNAGNGSKKLTANSGRFYPTDVGKAVELVASAANGWTNTWGYIVKYFDSTHVQYEPQPIQNTLPNWSGTLTIGVNEPDANYVVAGLCGDANETFWVDTIATTGFTLHSSNAGSTANVTALIVR